MMAATLDGHLCHFSPRVTNESDPRRHGKNAHKNDGNVDDSHLVL